MQPPPLNTSLNTQQFHGLGVGLGGGYASTPLSTTSLSSPFTQSPAVNSSGAALGSSPMASRQYNVPYNPQDWGPVSHGHGSLNVGQQAYQQSGNMLRIVPQHRSVVPSELSPPPPPYSPPSQQQHADHTVHNTPVLDSTSSSGGSPYMGASRQHSMPRTRPVSTVRPDASHNRQIPLPPPPPLPTGAPSSRSSSRNRSDVYHEQSSFGGGSRPYITVQEDNPHSQSGTYSYSQASVHRDEFGRAPSSRRAVSAGPVVSSASTSRATSQSRSVSPQSSAWEPGMPLPPPPPGPPPVPRSQSVNGLGEASSSRHSQAFPRISRQQPPSSGTDLGSIPPTPAGWVDEPIESSRRRDKMPMNTDTSSQAVPWDISGSGSREVSHSSRNSASGGLFRSPAVRDTSAKGIRERRTERRNRQSQVMDDHGAVSASTNPWADALDQLKPSNLVLNDQQVEKPCSDPQTNPRSNHSVISDGQTTVHSRASSTSLFSANRTPFSTPKAERSPLGLPSQRCVQTPPFSPNTEHSPTFSKNSSQAIPPKALPTPPLYSGQDSRPPSVQSRREDRPLSHILHLPNDSVSSPTLQPRRLSINSGQSLDSVVKQDVEFIQSAARRHKEFIEKESSAADEAEALRLFAEYIIAESQIRRERYAKAFESGSFNSEQIQQRLFQLPPKPPPEPVTRRFLKGPRLDIPQTRGESSWNSYKPCLSPIASLGISNDEMSSRGRAPSRWWESRTGSGSEGGERRPQRSKRESKYMGLPLGLRSQGSGGNGSEHGCDPFNQYASYGPDEYPPEKVGWHEDQSLPDYPAPATLRGNSISTEPQKMDVSRLITLPPPYPRHYPAVNNSHPELVTYRTLVRSISDHSEIIATKQRHASESEALWNAHRERMKENRRQFNINIQNQIQDGSISFAEAAEAEAALIEDENQRERTLAKQLLNTYQESVLKPMQAILTDRIDRATSCIDELRSKLFDDAQHESPDQTQEEGDEKPELLEKLTQLKWLFEAREQLHRELYDLISTRDEKYKAVVILPYKQKKAEDKVRSTNDFFARDTLDRRANYEASALARLESFQGVIEENVVRGVELQLSAFWDIAPSLLTLVQQLPENLFGFQIQIPPNEYEENPSYHDHPLQYLYTLVSHAEKSSYQFIESQINLLCLLHEVKSAVMRANCKLMETERIRQGEPEDAVSREMDLTRANEERALTNDLKDKVATVEEQWAEALGSQIQALRQRVRDQLEREDGWEDLEQLEQT
ncbi:hypothetical protein BJX61DRAFT_539951 [Aspergillus egyptiacus]|nr:hypothetical protein BJX61DRAFT_539951 [Aspergillus egyptiacus]